MAKWKITDNSTGSPVVWSFPISPNQFSHPGRSASIIEEATTSGAGATIIFQGRDAVPQLTFGGTINSSTMYTQLRAELDKWYDLVLTDDQGAEWNVIITNYTMTRKKSAVNQHRYEYNVTAKVLV
jgi:hypothetical protein